MNYSIDGCFVLKRFAECVDNLRRNLVGTRKFLKIERIHFKHIHVPNRNRARVLQVYAQQGTAKNILIAAFLNQKFDSRYNLFAFLHFVQKSQCFTGNQQCIGDWDRRSRKSLLLCAFSNSDCAALFS